MKNYRRAFTLTLALNVLLAAGLAFLWWRTNPTKTKREPAAQQTAGTPSADASAGGMGTALPAPTNAPLVPVQLTPQRLQSIGVKTGMVEAKPVQDEIRTVGSVEVDETRLAYVQVRFPGWIQKV